MDTINKDLPKIPSKWEWTQLSDICLLATGKTPSTREEQYWGGKIPFVTPSQIHPNGYMLSPQRWLTQLGAEKARVIPHDSILIVCIGSVGKIGYLDKDAVINQQLNALLPSEHADSKLLFYWAKFYLQNWVVRNAVATVNAAILNKTRLGKAPVPLPPLNEQHRIVEKIETLTTHSRKAREALDAIPLLLDQFRQSVLAAAFRGDLTADWRAENPDVESGEELLEPSAAQLGYSQAEIFQEIDRSSSYLPQKWTWTKLKTVVVKIKAGKNFKCPEIPVEKNAVGLVKISAVTWGKFDPLETKTVEDESKIDPSLFIEKGDLLVTRANTLELVGASVVVDAIDYKIMLSDKVWRIETGEIHRDYLNFYLSSKAGRKEIEKRASGNQQSMRNISQKAFLDIVITFPPLKEQIEIAERIKTIFSSTESIQEQYRSSLSESSQLDQSILAKAFRGELVPQDPTDEPATHLLNRIRTERAKTQKTKKKTQRKKKS